MNNQEKLGAHNKANDVGPDGLESRRRLLKASAAMPLIATLSPRYALAQSSVQCDEKPNNFANVTYNPTADRAVRAMATCYQSSQNGDGSTLYMVGDENYVQQGRAAGEWFKVYGSGRGEPIEPPSNGELTSKYLEGTPCYVICYLSVDRDTNGKVLEVRIVSFYPESLEGDSGGTSISGSCMTSLMPDVSDAGMNR